MAFPGIGVPVCDADRAGQFSNSCDFWKWLFLSLDGRLMDIINALLMGIYYIFLRVFAVAIPLCFFVVPPIYIIMVQRRLKYIGVCSCVAISAHLVLLLIVEMNVEYDLLYFAAAPFVQIVVCVICHFIWKGHFRRTKDKPQE